MYSIRDDPLWILRRSIYVHVIIIAVVNYAIPVIKKLCLAEVDHLKARKKGTKEIGDRKLMKENTCHIPKKIEISGSGCN